MSDPLDELAPFLKQARKSKPEFSPPDYLTVRLMETRGGALEPAVSPVPEGPTLPRKFGPYLLEKVLGHGGTGTVYQAYDPELERAVALKILSPSLGSQRDAAVRFLREARAMAKLSHDHLMPLLAVHQETPEPCYTMPLLEGETLEDRVQREGPLSVDETVKLAEQICSGLVTAHDADLVHRDLKPSNIFLETTATGPRARIMDFGLVKAGEDPALTREGEMAGTPSFMAPEQIDGLVVDGRADLYALGATLFTVLTGKPPFEGKTLTSTLRQVASTEAPELSELDPSVPSWLSVLVNQLLQKEATNRPANARLVAVRLKDRKSAATSTGGIIQTSWLVGAFLAAAVLGGILWLSSSLLERKEEEGKFEFEAAIANLQSGDVWTIPAGVHYLKSIDLGGRDLRIEGSEKGSRLEFVKLAGPAFVNAGNLELVNLTINCSGGGEGENTPLVESSGDSVTLIHCRVEQKQSSQHFPDSRTLIEAAAGSETLIRGCEFYTFQSVIWRMRKDARLKVEDSLLVSPGLSFSASSEGSSGQVSVQRSTLIHQVGLTYFMEEDESPVVGFSLQDSIIECSHSLLWLPMGDEETLRGAIDYEANKVLFLMERNLVSTAVRPRVVLRRGGIVDRWQPSQWSKFWGEKEKDTFFQKESLIEREGITDRVIENLQAEQLEVPTAFRDWGANLKKVGPRGGALQ
jgi:serine/threonine protein kinase